MRVLLVEDDSMIGKSLQDYLHTQNYSVDWVCDGQTAEEAISTQSYDFLLLDLGLPGKDGMKVLRNLRESARALPVIILTARDGEAERLAGLNQGADDYLVKPFSMAEVVARMRAIGRRLHQQCNNLLENRDVLLDTQTFQATVKASGETVTLSQREFAILQALLQRPGAILSREQLEDKVYAWGNEVESNAIDYQIHQLRRKLGKQTIRNIRGAGWQMGANQ